MSDRHLTRDSGGLTPFVMAIPIGLVGVVISLLLGVRTQDLAYSIPIPVSAAGALMGVIMAWRAQAERAGRTMDFGSAWRAPLFAAGPLAAALFFADAGDKAELVLYSGLLGTSLGLFGGLYTRLVQRRHAAEDV